MTEEQLTRANQIKSVIDDLTSYKISMIDRNFDDVIEFGKGGSPTFNQSGPGYDFIRSVLKERLKRLRDEMIEITEAEIHYQELLLKSL